MKIIFRVAKYGTLLDRAVDFCSKRLGYSHVELVFSDGMCFSSDSKDNGCRFKKIPLDTKYWRIYDIKVDDQAEQIIRNFCKQQVGKKYDYAGVIGFILPIKDNKKKWFCSEVCITALQTSGLLGYCPPEKISPNDLYLNLETAKTLSGQIR